MSFDYASVAKIATAQIKNFGRSVTLRKATPGTYDTATGLNSPTSVDSTRSAVLSDFASGQVNGPGGLIKQLDKKLLMEPGTSAPGLEDRVIVGTDDYGVIGIMEINPAGVPLAYTLHLRK